MDEDAQPNERPVNRKGGAIPVIYPIRGSSGHREAQTYHPIRGSSSQHYPSTNSYTNPHYTYLARRPQSNPRNGLCAKQNNPKAPGSTPSLPLPPPQRSRFQTKDSFKTKSRNEAMEFLIDVPPHCKTGPQSLRKQWQELQVRELSRKTGAKLQFGGYVKGCARFILDEKPTPVAEATNDKQLITETKNIHDSDLGGLHTTVSISDRQTSALECHSFTQEKVRALPMLERGEPLRVFSSGVLSLSAPLSPPPYSSSLPANHIHHSDTARSTSDELVPPATNSLLSFTHDFFKQPVNELVYTLPSTPAVRAIDPSCAITFPDHESLDGLNKAASPQPTACRFITEDIFAQVPALQSDKVRCILSWDMTSVVSVSMRGSINSFNLVPLRHRRTVRTSKLPGEAVDDACLLRVGDKYITVLGHAQEHKQLSWYPSEANMIQGAYLLNRPWNTQKKGGVSAVASMIQPLQFATGGYDHVVHLWDIKPDLSSVSPRMLNIKHSSQVQSLLAIQNSSHKLVSAGADCNVHIWDLSSERVVSTMKTSNAVYHVHQTTSPFCTLLEVAHRELQFEVRDHRLVPKHPVQRFGYTTDKAHGRFIEGATFSNHFACGGRDGSVRLWDLRNTEAAPVTVTSNQGQKIIQVIFKQPYLVVCSQNGKINLIRHDGHCTK